MQSLLNYNIFTMLNFEIDNNSILQQEFGLRNVGEDSFGVLLEEDNFDQLSFKFSDALNEMLAHENDEDSEIESYSGEYDSDIEAELEQNDDDSDNEQNFNNEREEERNEIIPKDTDEGSTCKRSILPLIPCIIIDNIQGTIKQCNETYKLRKIQNLYGT